jgi:hypothetical protein
MQLCLHERLAHVEALYRQEHELNQRVQADFRILENELHIERKEHQANVAQLQMQIQELSVS